MSTDQKPIGMPRFTIRLTLKDGEERRCFCDAVDDVRFLTCLFGSFDLVREIHATDGFEERTQMLFVRDVCVSNI